ncbi:MAG: glycosyltransferase, partial [Myxococcales bacterium]
ARVIRELAAAHPGEVVGQFHPHNRGIAAAWRTGTDAARGGHVALLDADLQYQPEDLLRLWRVLREQSVDVVQGWRSPVGRERDSRYHLSRGFNLLLNAAFGMKLHDNKSGFVCAAREVMLDLLTHRGPYHYPQSFIMVAAHARGYAYREIETLFAPRKQGQSFLDGQSYRAAARSLVDLGRAVGEYRLATPPHDVAGEFLDRHRVERPEPPSRAAHPVRWRAYMSSFEATHWMITRDVERQVETLNATQWLTPSQLRDLQDEKLRRLVRHAYRSVPYYRHRMQEAGLRPEDIRTQDDLPKLPYLTKADVRRHLYFDIMAEGVDHDDILRVATSGSTGEPFVCYVDRRQLEFRWAATLRSQEWTGYRLGDPSVRLWHQTLGLSARQAWQERADARFVNRTHVPIFDLTPDRLDAMVALLAERRPVLIDGYAEAFDYLAQYLQARGRKGRPPRALMSSAQTLPRRSRELIESSFGGRVFDKYGSREFSGIAYESDAHDGHLIVAEGYIVEVLVDGRPAAPDEVGEVFVTDLNNRCLPFIRYRIGDLAQGVDHRPSPCGRGLPRIGEIQGRVQSIIQGTDHRWVPGTFFAHALKEFDHAIRQYQIVQDTVGAIRFRVVKGGRYSDDVIEECQRIIRRHLGHDLRIDLEFVDRIEMVRTGKRLASMSTLTIDFQRDGDRLRTNTSAPGGLGRLGSIWSFPIMRVIVTGSEGFVGRHLRAALRARCCQVRGLDRPGTGAEVECDLSDPALDPAALARALGPA